MLGDIKSLPEMNSQSMKEPDCKPVSLWLQGPDSFFCSWLVVEVWIGHLFGQASVSSSIQVDNNTDMIRLWWEVFGDDFQEGLRTGLVTGWGWPPDGWKVGTMERRRVLWWGPRQVLYQEAGPLLEMHIFSLSGPQDSNPNSRKSSWKSVCNCSHEEAYKRIWME